MFFIVLLYMHLNAKQNKASRKVSRKVKGSGRKSGRKVNASRKGRKGTRKSRMRGGNCGCSSIFPLKGGSPPGSNSISALPIHNYYKQNNFQNDPTYMQTASRLNGGKKQKGGNLNATNIIKQFGDSTGAPYYSGLLTGSPYVDSSPGNQPIGVKYGASNLYMV